MAPIRSSRRPSAASRSRLSHSSTLNTPPRYLSSPRSLLAEHLRQFQLNIDHPRCPAKIIYPPLPKIKRLRRPVSYPGYQCRGEPEELIWLMNSLTLHDKTRLPRQRLFDWYALKKDDADLPLSSRSWSSCLRRTHLPRPQYRRKHFKRLPLVQYPNQDAACILKAKHLTQWLSGWPGIVIVLAAYLSLGKRGAANIAS